MKKLILSLTLLASAITLVSPLCAAAERLTAGQLQLKKLQLIELRLRIARQQLQQAINNGQPAYIIQEYRDEIRNLEERRNALRGQR